MPRDVVVLAVERRRRHAAQAVRAA
jgi:hypothetical protein